MASSSDGASAPLLPAMPDYTSPSLSHSTAGELKHHLQALLDSKERQLQSTATLGQRVLAQQMELEERVRQLQDITLDKGEDEDVDSETRQRLRELGDTIKAWDTQNAQLSSAFGTPSRHAAFPPAVRLNDMPREEPERLKSSTSAAQSRRAKNAAHRADDVEFAFEIGSGLLTEVRRLQSLLAERDKVIQDMKEEKDDLEKSVATLRTTLIQQEQSADKYKEENWNLEVTLQELRTQLTDAQAANQRLEGEQKRLNKLLAGARDGAEQQKNDIDRLQTTMEEMKAKHETDIAQARKISAGLQRDKSDLQQSIDALKAEQARNARRLPRFGTPVTPNGSTQDISTPGPLDEDDIFSTATSARRKTDHSGLYPDKMSDYADSSPDASPARPFLAPNHPSNEVEALQQRLAHAQRQVNTLKGSLQREKELKMEYRRKLEASTGEVEEEEDGIEEDDVVLLPLSSAKTKRGGSLRAGGSRLGNRRGRGRGGMTLFQRLAASSPASEFNDEPPLESSPPPVPPIPLDFQEDGEEEEDVRPESNEGGFRAPSPSPFDPPVPNRASIDGMDPAFANILKRTSSTSSIPRAGSPLRQAAQTRGGSLGRRRGGAAYQQIRPPSLIGPPEVLAAELGFGTTPMKDTSIYEEVARQTADFACQTEVVETPPPPPPPMPVTSERGVQIEPPSEPTVPTVEMACQTEETPVRRSDFAVQHNYVEPKPLLVSTAMSTDPEPVPPTVAHVEIQSIAPLLFDVDTQTAPAAVKLDAESQTPSQSLPSTPRRESVSLGGAVDDSITPTRRAFAIYTSDDDGEETETPADSDTEAETETDTDDYMDASQSIMTPTPSASVDDFHSLKTMSDTEDDDVSIKASRQPSRQDYLTAPSSYTSLTQALSESVPEVPRISQEVQAVRAVTYDSKSVTAVPPPEPEPEVPPPVELKEMSIQTDEWKPPPPPVMAAPIPQSVSNGPLPGFGLYRVAPAAGQQIQFVPTPPPPPAQPPPSAPALASGFRDMSHIRRQSTDSARSSVLEDLFTRPASAMAVDKSRPPMMMLPPPPRMPPPPSSAMPPPSFIPDKRAPKISAGSREMPPPRPSSPPPAELIQRATTPTFGSILNVPGRNMMRQHGSSLPSQQPLYQPPSTSSFRSVPNAAAVSQGDAMGSMAMRERGRERSTTSLTSERSMASPRSSISSEQHVFRNSTLSNQPATPGRSINAANTSATTQTATDPEVIHAITQTMIGEFLYKYTRRAIGKGHTNARHKRFFWVHPYTKTLYWSDADPGSSKVSESSAKSSYIEGVRSVLDPNPMPPGLHQYSIVVSTPQRDMKITAPTKERHDIWLNALRYLLTRSGGQPGQGPQSPMSGSSVIDDEQQRTVFASPQSQRTSRSRATEWSVTPRGQRSRSQLSARGSIGKRSGTPAAEYLRWNGPESPHSPSKSFEQVAQDEEDLDFALHSDSLSDEGFEGLENVRTCCNGRHTVGSHHHHDLPGDPPPEPEPAARPVSPSGWSFRSRSGSVTSRDATSLFSWGKAEGKMRFGSRRSTKTVVLNDS